jgi:hypothetical protein
VGEDRGVAHRDDHQLVKRNVAIALALVGATLLGLCAAGLGALVWLSGQLGASPHWVVVRKAPPQLPVKTTAKELHFRETGFTDPHYELLFEVDDVARFLEDNGLTQGPVSEAAVDDAPVKPSRVVELEGFADDAFYRSGQLWDVGGRTYAYLVAFGT